MHKSSPECMVAKLYTVPWMISGKSYLLTSDKWNLSLYQFIYDGPEQNFKQHQQTNNQTLKTDRISRFISYLKPNLRNLVKKCKIILL